MSEYDKYIIDDDLGTYKNSGAILTTSIVISGSVAGGAEKTVLSSVISIENIDFNEVTFDNSTKHSGRFHNISEGSTFVRDNTLGIDFSFLVTPIVGTNTLQFKAWLLNTTSSTLSLESTTLNFRYVPYESTI